MKSEYLPSNFGLNNNYWLGMVEDRSDPLQLGRVRVRIFGHHTEDKNLIPTELLPWAIPLMPTTSAALSGVGQSPTGIMNGSLCIGIWLDGADMQSPMILGTINNLESMTSGFGNKLGLDGQNMVTDNNYGVPGDYRPTGDGPAWLQVARGELGQKEIKGGQYNPRILEYGKTVGIGWDDETPWCAAFIAWCLQQAGVSIQGVTSAAKSFLDAPGYTPINDFQYGCIVVSNRGGDPTKGHVGFYCGSQGGRILVIGGNQGPGGVTIGGRSTANIAGLRMPPGLGTGSVPSTPTTPTVPTTPTTPTTPPVEEVIT